MEIKSTLISFITVKHWYTSCCDQQRHFTSARESGLHLLTDNIIKVMQQNYENLTFFSKENLQGEYLDTVSVQEQKNNSVLKYDNMHSGTLSF